MRKISTKQRVLTLGRQRKLRAHLKRNMPRQTLALLDTDVCIDALEALVLMDFNREDTEDEKKKEAR